jgi:hypothetical protein
MAAPLIGRADARAVIRDALADTVAGRGGVLWLSGEAGIGKTRLLAELATLADAGGGVVLRGAGWEDPGTPAFWLWTQVLRDAAAFSTADGWRPEARALLAGSFPETDAATRFPLFDAVRGVVTGLAETRPLVLLLDDLHWADLGSLRLLAFVASAAAGTRLLLAGGWRSGEASLPGAAADLLGRARVVELTGLDPSAVGELIASVSGQPVTPADAVTVAAQTGGNPLFVEQMSRLARARGQDTVAGTVPASAIAVIQRRVARLSQPCHDLLVALAVAGPDAHPGRLAALLGGRPDGPADLVGPVDEAVATGLVTERVQRLSFTHALLREAVYADISPSRRRALHLAAADQLAADGAPDAEVVRHLLRAVPLAPVDRVVAVGERAARAAVAMQAYEDAADLYGRLLDLVPPTDEARFRLLLEQGEAVLAIGDVGAARPAFVEVTDFARRTGDPESFARAALGFAAGLAGFEIRLRDELQLDLLREALERLPEEDSELRAYAMARLSVALSLSASTAERAALAEQAVAMSRRLGLVAGLGHALAAWCDAFAGPADTERREVAATEIISLAGQARDRPLELLGLRHRVVARLERGATALAEADMGTYTRLAGRLRQPLYSWYGPLWRGLRAQLRGDLDEMAACADEAERTGALVGSRNAVVLSITQRLWVAYDRRRSDELHENYVRVTTEMLDQTATDETFGGLYPGRPAHARQAALPQLAAVVEGLPVDAEWLMYLCHITTALFDGGETPEYAATMRDRLLPYAQRFAVDGIGAATGGSVHLYLGMQSAMIGDRPAAYAHFAASLEANTAAGNQMAVAATHRARAIAAHRWGDQPAAGDHLAAARAAYDDLGRPERAAEMAALLDGPPESDEPGPAGCAFRREGATWRLTYAARTATVRHSKGMADLAALLAHPGQERHALDLAGGGSAAEQPDTGPLLDDQAKTAYRRRLDDLADAGDEASLAERDALIAQLSAAYGLGGRQRRTGAAAERARSAVTLRIRDAIARIGREHPELGRHLRASVRTGVFCSYQPEQPVDWQLTT